MQQEQTKHGKYSDFIFWGGGLFAPAFRFAAGFPSRDKSRLYCPSRWANCLLVFVFCAAAQLSFAQNADSLPAKKHFTVGVRRSPQLCNDTSRTAPKIVLSTAAIDVTPESSGDEPTVAPAVRLPRLLGGELAFVPIEEWDKENHEQHRNNRDLYVVFRLTIGKNGKATNIIWLDTNSTELLRVIKGIISASHWAAARDAQSQPTSFTYPIQVLYLPPNYEFIDHFED